MVKNKTIAYRIFLVFDYILLGAFAIMCLLPVLHVAFASFSDPAWVMSNSGLILRPHGFNIDGYQQVFSNRSLMGSYGNTILYVAASTGIGLLVTVLGAYPLSKKEVLFSNALMLVISFTMLFNGGMVAFYIVVKNIGLLDSRWAVILPTCVSAFNLILVRTAMSAIPKSLEESAMLDGAGPVRIMFQIYLPLIKATMATVILYYAVAHWNSWFNASLFLKDRGKFPLQLILREILIANDTASNATQSGDVAGNADLYKQLVKYCTIMVATVPVLCFYPFIMKYFEKGVMIGSIKG
ncbi:MAG: carbohydrate ABC transporter permease [Acutalibacter sp.]|jgi:putative aldouronate transport system permease protein|nr:carbohydrate ABC transporter permease [Acutalibacter sp.]